MTDILIAVFGFLGVAIGAVGQYLIAKRKASFDARKEDADAQVERDTFTIDSAKTLLDMLTGSNMTLRQQVDSQAKRITELETTNSTQAKRITELEIENIELKHQIGQLSDKVTALSDCLERKPKE